MIVTCFVLAQACSRVVLRSHQQPERSTNDEGAARLPRDVRTRLQGRLRLKHCQRCRQVSAHPLYTHRSRLNSTELWSTYILQVSTQQTLAHRHNLESSDAGKGF